MYNDYYNMTTTSSSSDVLAGFGITYFVIVSIISLIQIIAMWKIFSKAGEAGWKSIIPVYNLVVLFKICGMSPWMILLLLVPIANVVVGILTCINLAKVFGKGGGFAAGLIFLSIIFELILAFGSAEYKGVQA